MKNKKSVKFVALILAGSLVIAGGVGTLGLTMAKAQQETITKEVKSETDSVEDGTEIGEGVTLQESQADSEVRHIQKPGESEVEITEIEQFQKSWKDFDIAFISFGTKQKKGDLEITDALEKAVKYVKKESGKTITGGKVEIQLTDGLGDVVVEDSFAAIYYSDDYVFARKYQITFNPGTDDEMGVTMNAVTGEIYGIHFMMKEEKQ